MAKKIKAPVSQDEFEAELQSTPQVFDTVTIGIAKTDSGYSILKVSVDSKGLEAGEVEVLDTAEGKWEANEKFKIHVIKQGVL
jgi:hypothetical protein